MQDDSEGRADIQPRPDPVVTSRMGELKIEYGTDCSEIAADLLAAAGGRGRILRVEPSTYNVLILREYGELDSGFVYHDVYTDGHFVYDPRLSPAPVPLEEWETMIYSLNPGATIQ
jgi:hypothetical protein